MIQRTQMLANAPLTNNSPKPPAVREYYFGDTRYVVTATVKAGANEDAKTKVRRLIRNEMSRKAQG